MTRGDPRLTVHNARLASSDLRGQVNAPAFVEGTLETVRLPLVDLLRAPGGPRDRQLRMGARVWVFEKHDGWAYLRDEDSGYVGYARSDALGPDQLLTHRVAVPATHAYDGPRVAAPDLCNLGFDCRLQVLDEREHYYETPLGFIPKPHLRPLSEPFHDPVTVAQLFFGVPYLWGGNTIWGVDCSGLVQISHSACNIPCPGDSDLQQTRLGAPVSEGTPVQRGDLFFWAGHVAQAVDPDTILHASGHKMAVVYEPLSNALQRIEAQGGGPLLAHRRVR